MTFISLILSLFLGLSSAFAAKLIPIDIDYIWKKTDTLDSAILENLDPSKITESNLQKLVAFNKKKNPAFSSIETIKEGQVVKLKIPEKYLRKDQFKTKFKPLNFLLYSLSSLGKFSEQSPTLNYQASWSQNSPVTLGLGLNYYFSKDSLEAISAGLYYSYFLPSESTDADFKNIKSLNEYGFVLQYQMAPSFVPFLLFSGLDYESFSTLNTAELILNGPPVDPVRHTLIFATLGIGHSIYLTKKPILAKLTISQTVLSSTSREIFSAGAYKGQKLLMSLTYPVTKRFITGVIYKMHQLKNETTEIKVSRLGFTFGYTF